MNYRTGIKKLLIFTAFLIVSLAFIPGAKASDYQYKVLDPKYNPYAEQIAESNLPPVVEVNLPKNPNGFDFGRFLAILSAIVFPIFIISLAIKTFKQVTEDIPGRIPPSSQTNSNSSRDETQKKSKPKQIIGNVRIPPSADMRSFNNLQDFHQKGSIPKNKDHVKSTMVSPRIKQLLKTQPQTKQQNRFSDNYVTSPSQNKNPMLLNTSQLTDNKGLCLVEYNQKYSLIGYINNEIFLLNQFKDLKSNEIRSRLSETVNNKDRYIVRLGSYKAIVEVSDTKMNVLLEL